MKKTTCLLLVCLLAFSALLAGCKNDVPPQNKTTEQLYSCTENPDGTLTLTGYKGMDSALSIPAKIDGKTVSGIGDSCFAGLLCLNTVHIPEGVTHIGRYAFECCSALRKVYFPASLKSIGDGAFSGCGSLILADFQDSVESIGTGAFLCCDALVQLELPAALTELGEFAFAGCGVLSSVRFAGDKLTALPDRVFYGCASLTRLRLPETICSVGKRAFSGCERLENLYFASPLTSLGSYAFEGCSKLSGAQLTAEDIPTGLFTGCHELSWFSVADGAVRIGYGAFGGSGISSLSIPASVEQIEPGAFYQMGGSIELAEDNSCYKLIDGSLYTADGKTLLAFFPADPYGEEAQTEYVVPEGVEVIASYALAESGLTGVTLPASLKRIDAYAFADTYIEDPAIPERTSVDPDAFNAPWQSDGEMNSDAPAEETAPEILGSVAGDKNLFRQEGFADYFEIGNEEFDRWGEEYLAFNESKGVPLRAELIPYIMRYKGEVVPHFLAMTAVQNRDPDLWAQAEQAFGDDFEQMYLMMDHGLSTELSRGKMEDNLILYSGLYDSQLMAAAGTDTLPTRQQLVDAIGNVFTDPIMISTTTDPGVAAGFGDTLFIIYASREAMEGLGAICIDAVAHSSEKEILMNSSARYRILDVGNMEIQAQDPWDPEPRTLYRSYVKVELLNPGDGDE